MVLAKPPCRWKTRGTCIQNSDSEGGSGKTISQLIQNILGQSLLVDEKHVALVFRTQTVKVVLAKPSASWSRISLAAASLSMKKTWHLYSELRQWRWFWQNHQPAGPEYSWPQSPSRWKRHVALVFRTQTVKVVLTKPSASWSRIFLATVS